MTGSITEKNGKYYAVLNFKDTKGNRKQKWVKTDLPIKGNKKRAEKILRELLEQYENEDIILSGKKILFSTYIQAWLDNNKANLQTTTYDGYVFILKKHIIPYFKERCLLLQDLKPYDIQKYYTDRIEYGLSTNTVIKHHGVIRTALQYAVKSKLIKENIADLVDKPKKKNTEAKYYNLDELNKLFEVSNGTSIETAVLLTSYYGLRRSECLGICYSNIDFDNKTISICHKVVRKFDDKGKLTFSQEDELKNKSSYRTLPLTEKISNHLLTLKQKQAKNMALCGDCYNKEYLDYVCVDALGSLLKPDYITHKFTKLIRQNGLKPLNFHGLRHSCATLLLTLGYDMKSIQEWLGHANLQTTANIYVHVDNAKKSKMLDSVESMFII